MHYKGKVTYRKYGYAFLIVIFVVIAIAMYDRGKSAQEDGLTPSIHYVTLSRQQPWIEYGTFPANTVLHWRQINFNYDSRGIDSTNGKEILADIWVQIGANRLIAVYHAIYTNLNGTFVQEIFDDSKISIVIYSKADVIFAPKPLSKNWCIDQQPSNPDALQSRLPAFIDESVLVKDGFQRSGNTFTKPFLITPTQGKLYPTGVYNVAGTVQVWIQEVHHTEFTTKRVIEFDQNFRVLLASSKTQNYDGLVEQENWVVLGSVYIYSLAPSFKSFLSMPSQLQKGCPT